MAGDCRLLDVIFVQRGEGFRGIWCQERVQVGDAENIGKRCFQPCNHPRCAFLRSPEIQLFRELLLRHVQRTPHDKHARPALGALAKLAGRGLVFCDDPLLDVMGDAVALAAAFPERIAAAAE